MSRLLDTRCELCGSWSWCGRQCARAEEGQGWLPQYARFNGHEIAEPPTDEPVPVVQAVSNVSLTKLTKAEVAVDKVEARKAYQRELMRKRRLEAKLKAHTT
jgi:hypothetical protein